MGKGGGHGDRWNRGGVMCRHGDGAGKGGTGNDNRCGSPGNKGNHGGGAAGKVGRRNDKGGGSARNGNERRVRVTGIKKLIKLMQMADKPAQLQSTSRVRFD
ncbi:hypothetical protein L6452_18701 [Arctium lappa]|uniref:Uncharacterized protein n=1 Tax=Arctium lappa TaxID=4217 RepID=A0ACB9C750_ARCLA|nr:hypothetical protein L6452_18701 [Arctium lappa]